MSHWSTLWTRGSHPSQIFQSVETTLHNINQIYVVLNMALSVDHMQVSTVLLQSDPDRHDRKVPTFLRKTTAECWLTT